MSGHDPMNIHHQAATQGNRYVGQEQSVERLKSCIADLKKLATSKVKKTTAASNSNLNSNSNLHNV